MVVRPSVVIAGARGSFTKEETNRLRTYLMTGGSLFLAGSPINAQTENGMAPAGRDEALAPFGEAPPAGVPPSAGVLPLTPTA